MVQGYMTCLGSVQQLLMRYNHGYVLTVMMRSGYTIDTHLLPELRAHGCCELTVYQASGVRYASIGLQKVNEFGLSRLYSILLEMQQQLQTIEYFSLGQSQLENVFLAITNKFAASSVETSAI